MTNTFGRIACRCAVVMVVVSKLALLVLVVVLGGNVRASATTVSYTGAELLSLPEVFFPTRPPAVQGDSLSFEAGDQRYEILLRWELLEPGSLSLSGGSVRVEVLADLTRQSADWEAFITLWDGTKAIGGGLYNNDGGGVQNWVATSDGVHITQPVDSSIESLGSLFSIGQSGQFALEFELTKSSSQVSASGAGASIQYSTSVLDLSQGLGVLVFMQDEWEQLDVNSIRVTAIPGLCIFGGDTSCNTDDLDALYEVFNTHVPPTDSLFDLNSDTVVDTADLDRWLSLAATENGYGSPYLRGDTELDRDVDITDFDRLAHFFDFDGTFRPNEWWEGNFDGDDDIDITDFKFLASNFAPDGYGASAVPEPSAFLLAILAVILLGGMSFVPRTRVST